MWSISCICNTKRASLVYATHKSGASYECATHKSGGVREYATHKRASSEYATHKSGGVREYRDSITESVNFQKTCEVNDSNLTIDLISKLFIQQMECRCVCVSLMNDFSHKRIADIRLYVIQNLNESSRASVGAILLNDLIYTTNGV